MEDLFLQFKPSKFFYFINDAMIVSLIILGIFIFFACVRVTILPNPLQQLLEIVHDQFEEQLGPHAHQYLPLMVTMFFFIAIANILGTIPCVFPLTSHFSVTFVLALIVWLVSTIGGLISNPKKFLQHFLIPGLPLTMSPFMAIIEFIAYCLRPITLCLRLTVNVIAGHVLLEVLAELASIAGMCSIFPVSLMIFVNVLEFGVCIMQAAVFTILSCVYIRESCH